MSERSSVSREQAIEAAERAMVQMAPWNRAHYTRRERAERIVDAVLALSPEPATEPEPSVRVTDEHRQLLECRDELVRWKTNARVLAAMDGLFGSDSEEFAAAIAGTRKLLRPEAALSPAREPGSDDER